MSHQIALLGLMALTHILCYAAMTERKYSVRKTALIYALYAAFSSGARWSCPPVLEPSRPIR